MVGRTTPSPLFPGSTLFRSCSQLIKSYNALMDLLTRVPVD